MSYNIFVSYSTYDLEKVSKFVSLLKSNTEINVFVAENNMKAGALIPKDLISSIKKCHLFVLFWSKQSKNSEWVNQEIGIAKSENKTIIPILLSSKLELPAFIKDLKYLSAYSNIDDSLKIFQKNVLERADKHKQINAIVGFTIGAALLYILSK